MPRDGTGRARKEKKVAGEIPLGIHEDLANALHDPRWREDCHRDADQVSIPSGITYLSQFLAHDTTMTVASRRAVTTDTNGRADGPFVNLVDVPLTLSTLYGRPGAADRLIYDPYDDDKFDLLAVPYRGETRMLPKFMSDPKEPWFHPVFADQRNFASPILTQITVELQSYHNRIVDYLKAKGDDAVRENAFAIARAAVIRTWHNIVEKEVLPAIARRAQGAQVVKAPKTDAETYQRFADLAHGALRCFHSLVLERYEFNEIPNTDPPRYMTHPSSDMLNPRARGPRFSHDGRFKTGASPSMVKEAAEWLDQWGIDWPLFFGKDIEKVRNRTGFTPSFAFEKGGKKIGQRDFDAAVRNGVSTLKALGADEKKIQARVAQLCSDLDRVLETDDKWAALSPEQMPLLVALLADGYFDDEERGKLGRVASALVRDGVTGNLKQARQALSNALKHAPDAVAPRARDLPSSFLEMVETTVFSF